MPETSVRVPPTTLRAAACVGAPRASSRDEARRLYVDHAIDLREFLDSAVSLGVQFTPTDLNVEELQAKKTIVGSYVAHLGLTDADKRLTLGDIAEQVEPSGSFSRFNKVLSKLVHASALSILFPMTPELDAAVRTWLFEFGVKAADDALQVTVDRLAELGVAVDLLDGT